MKLTNTQTMKRKSGMTLLELTVVILVLLSLISILFIGARAWKRGSDRAGCILNLRNTQQAVRSYANMNNLNPGDAVLNGGSLATVIIGTGLFMETAPNCPGGGTYSGLDASDIPAVGVLAMSCDQAAELNHQPQSVAGW